MNRRTLIGSLAAVLAETVAAQNNSAPTGTGRKAVFLEDLPKVMLDNWTVTATEITYAPGAIHAVSRHANDYAGLTPLMASVVWARSNSPWQKSLAGREPAPLGLQVID